MTVTPATGNKDEETKNAGEWFQNSHVIEDTYEEDMDDIRWKLSEPGFIISIDSDQ